MKLEGLVAIVTGGATGIGAGITKALVDKGCKVVVASSNPENGQKIEKELGSDKVHFIRTDMTVEDDIKTLVKDTVEKFGAIHIVVNNSGTGFSSPVNTNFFSLQNMMDVFKLNLFGPLLLIKYASIQILKQSTLNDKNERGIIINVSSLLSMDGGRFTTFYAGSKAALNGVTLPLARELGKDGIRIITIVPGYFQTAMTSYMEDKIIDTLNKLTPLNRPGDIPSVGDMTVSLVENTYITGCIIRIDGGLRSSF